MKLWFFTPYAPDKNLGAACNRYCSLAGEDDWICLMDGDCMFLRSDFGHLIKKYITSFPDVKLFLPVVNRVGSPVLCYDNQISDNPDIRYHKQIADRAAGELDTKNLSDHRYPTMPVFVFSKQTWRAVGGFTTDGTILGTDNRFSQKVSRLGPSGHWCYQMSGVYVFHYYRMNEGINNKSHVL